MPNKQLNNPVEALAFCMFGDFFFEMPEVKKKTTLELCELRLNQVRQYGFDMGDNRPKKTPDIKEN